MREILFRAKKLNKSVFDETDWVYGSLIDSGNHEQVAIYPWINEASTMSVRQLVYARMESVIPETVGQFTGLVDKNKVKIFEGDLVKFGIDQRLMYVHWNEETLTWEITDVGVPACEVNHLTNTFDLGQVQVESAYGEVFTQVVGNIYDESDINGRKKYEEVNYTIVYPTSEL